MKDLNNVIQEALKEINFEEIAKDTATAEVKKAVKEAVQAQFKSYSGFSKKLEEHLKGELGIDFSAIKLPEYRAFLIGAINNALASFTTTEHAAEAIKYINLLVVGETRDEIEFSIFWDELCEKIKDGCDEDEHEKYFISFNQKDETWSNSRSYWNLTISVESASSKNSKKEVLYAAFSDGKIYHMRSDEYELSQIHTWLKAIRYRKTKILNPEVEETVVPSRHE